MFLYTASAKVNHRRTMRSLKSWGRNPHHVFDPVGRTDDLEGILLVDENWHTPI